MHTYFFGDFFNHHGLQGVLPMIEKFSLPRDDGLAHAQDGVLSLLDVFHQLDSGGETFLDVVAHVAIGSVFNQQAAVSGTQAKLRHVVFIEEGDPLVVYFSKVNVGLDQARLGFVVTQSRTGIELANDFKRALDHFKRPI
jgi:hypothetical protein